MVNLLKSISSNVNKFNAGVVNNVNAFNASAAKAAASFSHAVDVPAKVAQAAASFGKVPGAITATVPQAGANVGAGVQYVTQDVGAGLGAALQSALAGVGGGLGSGLAKSSKGLLPVLAIGTGVVLAIVVALARTGTTKSAERVLVAQRA